MKTNPVAAAAVGAVLLMSGCAGHLVVYEGGQEIKGMPIRTTEVYVKQGYRDKLAAGGTCDKRKFSEVVSIPTGRLYHVAVRASWFAKNSFRVKYHESGAVSEVGLDSEPSAVEALKSVAELYKVLGAAPAAPASARAGTVPCDVGEDQVTYTLFDAYLKKHVAP
jgi:hypothetical protein